MTNKETKTFGYLTGLLIGLACRAALWLGSVYLAIITLRYLGWL